MPSPDCWLKAAMSAASAVRPRQRAAKLRALMRFGAALGVIALIWAAAFGSIREAGDPRFALRAVSVSGARRTGAVRVLAAAALPLGRNVWLLDVKAAARRVRSLPWIDTATIRRAWPNRLSIVVTERTPVARISLAASPSEEEPVPREALIDGSARVLDIQDASPSDAGLPRLIIAPATAAMRHPGSYAGQAASQALTAQRRLGALGIRATLVQVAPATGISVKIDGRQSVLLGTVDDLEKKVALTQVIAAKITHPDRVLYIDVRSVRAPTVMYR